MNRDVAHIQAKLNAYLPTGHGISAVKPMTTGFSNETYLLEGLNWILRLPSAAGAMLEGHGVIAQAKIYQELAHTAGAPPVPKILVVCEDSSVLGAPFFIMERVEGESVHDTNLQSWFVAATDSFRTALSRKWISTFAGLAKLAPLQVLGDAVSPEDDARCGAPSHGLQTATNSWAISIDCWRFPRREAAQPPSFTETPSFPI